MRKSIRGKDISETKRVLDYTKDGYVILKPSIILKNRLSGIIYILEPRTVEIKYKDNRKSSKKHYSKTTCKWNNTRRDSIDFVYEQCELCNRDGQVFHHENYEEPFVGIFLCKGCHTRIHGRVKRHSNIYSITDSYMGMCRVQMRKLGITLKSY